MKLLGFGKDKKESAIAPVKNKAVDIARTATAQHLQSNSVQSSSAAPGAITPITKEQRDFQVEKINQQRYAIEVKGSEQDLRRAAAITATKYVKANTAEVKGQIAVERFTQATHSLQAAQIDTQRTALQPGNAQARLNGAQSQAQLQQVKTQIALAKNQLKARNFNLQIGGEK